MQQLQQTKMEYEQKLSEKEANSEKLTKQQEQEIDAQKLLQALLLSTSLAKLGFAGKTQPMRGLMG